MHTTDTTTFINGWHKLYHPDVFADFWVWIKELFNAKTLCAVRHVRDEIERQDDDTSLNGWLKTQKIPFVALDNEIQSLANDILDQFPNLQKKGSPHTDADSYIIAHAKIYGLIVITEEQPTNKAGKEKIPDVCGHPEFKIECINMLEFMRREGVQFIRRP